jgi:hypothetical protein
MIHLTKQERVVFIFVIATLAVGLGVRIFRDKMEKREVDSSRSVKTATAVSTVP